MRYGFNYREVNYREVSHDVVACSYALAVRLGPPSRLIINSLVHEMLLSVSGPRVVGLATIRLHTQFYTRVTKVQGSLSPEFPKLGCTGRADEDHSGVSLGSGTIHTTGLVKHLVKRLATSVS